MYRFHIDWISSAHNGKEKEISRTAAASVPTKNKVWGSGLFVKQETHTQTLCRFWWRISSFRMSQSNRKTDGSVIGIWVKKHNLISSFFLFIYSA